MDIATRPENMNVNSVWAHRDWAFLGRCFTVVVEKESRTYLCV